MRCSYPGPMRPVLGVVCYPCCTMTGSVRKRKEKAWDEKDATTAHETPPCLSRGVVMQDKRKRKNPKEEEKRRRPSVCAGSWPEQPRSHSITLLPRDVNPSRGTSIYMHVVPIQPTITGQQSHGSKQLK